MSDNSPIAGDGNSEADSLLKKSEFGAELKAAREAAGLSAEDIADSILISADIIRAIDNSRSDELPSATFTQGYIRSYSRILGISADKTIDAYNLSLPDSKQIISPTSVLPADKIPGKGSHNSLYFIFAIIFIVGAFYWVYNNLLQNQVMDVLKEAVNTEQNTGDNDEQINDTSTVTQEINIKPEEEAYFSEPELLGVSEEAVVEKQEINDKSLDQSSETLVDLNSEMMTLKISASEDSWCEVNDTETRLLYRLVKSGEVIEVLGKPPYRIFLGNAREVSILLNEREINFDELIRPNSKVVNLSLTAQAEVSRYTNN